MEESSGRSSEPQIKFVGPTVWSASLLMGWTHLSGKVVSLVDGDPGVPKSHNFKVMLLSSFRVMYIGAPVGAILTQSTWTQWAIDR
jgi:hypothetical protein